MTKRKQPRKDRQVTLRTLSEDQLAAATGGGSSSVPGQLTKSIGGGGGTAQ
ncbi:MAG TPA: hypothetical protein VFU21_26955 [Kofleriaceae bacterium]|nr:hypothetical protein [Kofleriaceae bacterium]